MSFPTPATAYTPSELSEAERVFWRSETQMNVAIKSTETVASQALADASTAQDSADDAQTDATSALVDIGVLDGEVVKKTGAQTIENIKTFTSFIEYDSIPASPEGVQVPRMSDVVSEATRNDNSWIAMTIMDGWTGNASVRKDRWGYLEVIFSITYASANSGFATLPSGYKPNYEYTNLLGANKQLTVLTDGVMYLDGTGVSGLESHYFRIKLSTPY